MKERANAKELILDRAVQMASVQGLNGLTIGHLAQELKMSKGGVCAHFPSKLELQLAAVERAAEIFRQAVVVPALVQPAGSARLQALGEAWFVYLVNGTFEGGCFFTNTLLELDDLDETRLREAVNEQYIRLIRLVEQTAAQAIEAGQFQPDLAVAQFAFEYVSLLIGAIVWRGLRRGTLEDRLALARAGIKSLLARAS